MNLQSKKQYIAIFDSGVGGLTLLQNARECLPSEHYLYYADSENVPYGNRSEGEILNLVSSATEQMTKYPLKAILVGSNIATSIAMESLRKKYDKIPIIGMEPVITPISLEGDSRHILVLTTKVMMHDCRYRRMVHSFNGGEKIDAITMQRLVDYAEEFDFDSSEVKDYIISSFSGINWDQYKAVIIGSTHFLYFSTLIRDAIPSRVHCLDANEETIKHLINFIDLNQKETLSHTLCILSGMEVDIEVIQPYFSFLKKQRNLTKVSV